MDARDNTATTGTGVPIYWLGGEKVADDYADFYDGSWDSRSASNESGGTTGVNTASWTGSNSNGTKHATLHAGASNVRIGSRITAGREISAGTSTQPSSALLTLYALSPVITVRAAQTKPKVSLSLGASRIDESGSNNSTTLRATLSKAVSSAVTVTLSASPPGKVRFGGTTLTIPANSTQSGTVTVTAVDNNVDAPDARVTISGSVSATAVDAPDDVTLTVTDDEETTDPLPQNPYPALPPPASHTIQHNRSLIPDGPNGVPLREGQSFRILFVGGLVDPTYDDIAWYNEQVWASFHNDNNHPLYEFRDGIRALISTEYVHARDNTATTGAGVPIYWANGARVADNYTDFYDGNWQSNAPTDGRGIHVSPSVEVWTGSTSMGTRDDGNWADASTVTYGRPGTGGEELKSGQASKDRESPGKLLYGITPVITVGADPNRRDTGDSTDRTDTTPSENGGTQSPAPGGGGGSGGAPSGGGGGGAPSEPEDTAPDCGTPDDFDCGEVIDLDQRECEALVSLYEATDGENWDWTDIGPRKQQWLTTCSPANWEGVELEEESVRELVLSGMNLVGELPEELGDLENLVRLDLSDNEELGGELPGDPMELSDVDISCSGIAVPGWAEDEDISFLSGCPAGVSPGPGTEPETVEDSGGGCAIASGKGTGAGSSVLFGLFLVAYVLCRRSCLRRRF